MKSWFRPKFPRFRLRDPQCLQVAWMSWKRSKTRPRHLHEICEGPPWIKSATANLIEHDGRLVLSLDIDAGSTVYRIHFNDRVVELIKNALEDDRLRVAKTRSS